MPVKSQELMYHFGVSLPKRIVEEVDIIRGDVNRSRWIQRLIEKHAMQGEQLLGGGTRPAPSTRRGLGNPKTPNG